MTIYEVFQPITRGPEYVTTGITISRHRTPEAAQRAIVAANARLTRQPGQRNAWHDYAIRAIEADGERRTLTDAEVDRIGEEMTP